MTGGAVVTPSAEAVMALGITSVPALAAAMTVLLGPDCPPGLDLRGASDPREVFLRTADALGWGDQEWLVLLTMLQMGGLPARQPKAGGF